MILESLRFITIRFLPVLIVGLFAACDMESNKRETESINKVVPNENRQVSKDLLKLRPNVGLVYYKDGLFTGYAINIDKDIVVGSTCYVNGKKNGLTQKWFSNKKLSYSANYINGKLDGVSYSWWKDGKLRSESHFKQGIASGTQKEWYKSGALFKEGNLDNGKESGLQRAWRENGKIYNNYEAKNGRIFGLKRSTLCYELNEEEVQHAD